MASRCIAYASVASLLLASVALAGCARDDGHGCSGDAAKARARLDRLAVLEEFPSGSTEVGRDSDCDADDPFVVAWRDFTSATPPSELIAHFRAAAESAGWLVGEAGPEEEDTNSGVPTLPRSLFCSSRSLFDAGATLTLSLDAPGKYRWQVETNPRLGNDGC